MGVDVGVEGPVPLIGSQVPGAVGSPRQIDEVVRPPAADVHGLDAGDTIDGDILGRHSRARFFIRAFTSGSGTIP